MHLEIILRHHHVITGRLIAYYSTLWYIFVYHAAVYSSKGLVVPCAPNPDAQAVIPRSKHYSISPYVQFPRAHQCGEAPTESGVDLEFAVQRVLRLCKLRVWRSGSGLRSSSMCDRKPKHGALPRPSCSITGKLHLKFLI